MKRIFLLAMLAISQLATSSQIILRGRVLEKSTRNPLAAASITIGHQSTISDEAGSFELRIPSVKNAVIEISHVEYQSVKDSLSIHLATNVQGENDLVFYLAKKDLFLQPVEVMALRSGDNTPFTKTDISKKELEKNNLGQDLPLLLGLTPATVINSDAGNGVG